MEVKIGRISETLDTFLLRGRMFPTRPTTRAGDWSSTVNMVCPPARDALLVDDFWALFCIVSIRVNDRLTRDPPLAHH